MMKQQIFLLL